MYPAYRNKVDQHLRELVCQPSQVNELSDSFRGTTSNNDNGKMIRHFGPPPRQQHQPGGGSGIDSLRGIGASEYVSSHAFGLPAQNHLQREAYMSDDSGYGATSYVTPHRSDSATLGPPSRLSFAPRSSQHPPEPRITTNAENLSRYTQNLRDGRPISIYHTDEDQSPITQLANHMVSQRSMSLHTNEVDPFGQLQSLHRPTNQEFELQKYQNIPHFGRNGGEHSKRMPDSSSPFNVSSPTARASLRKSRTDIQLEIGNTFRNSDQSNDVPYTPEKQLIIGSPKATQPTSQMLRLGHAPPMAQGIQLISPHELPDRFRPIFPYELFNAVQSKCFFPMYRSDDNVVISAPTGSGKTVLLELAICRLVESCSSGQFKIVYQAPTKSLCSERMRDWHKKFSHLNLAVAELTGDTSSAEMSKVGTASIIVTTPEKWDSITRKWKDHIRLLQLVKLFLIDEVHILKEIRGATLEAVVSRMKSIGASVRFVALSATVPNSHDIAVWLGKDSTNAHLPAHREVFGEGFRPVKLQKHVYGFEGNMNDFAFEKILDGKLPGLIQKHTHKKSIMVFCFTRKSCEGTAALLAEWWTRQPLNDRAWPSPKRRAAVGLKELQDLVDCGVAYHHAGLEVHDRAAIETAFLKGDISVICSTSTLAIGINLPCHLVILKGTVCFQDGGLCEYSDLEVMQMLGRAGRPQFDDSAIAIIMTRMGKADRYKKMVSGQDILESTLHLNLIEHLNSEIGLGTINDIHSAKSWLAGTFLSVRLRQNSNYYKIDGVPASVDADERLELVAERDIKLLKQHDLITSGERFKCTEFGEAMSRYMVHFDTMKLLLGVSEHARTEEILFVLCQASEFKELRMKPHERPPLREFNKSPFIKFPIKENISKTSHKIYLMIQAQLGGIELPNTKDFPRRQFMYETNVIFERVQRLARCIIECKSVVCDAIALRHALDLARSLSAEFWEYSSLQLRQLPQIGPAAVRKLVGNNVNTVDKLASLDTAGIERVLGKNPPFGKKMLEVLVTFPSLLLDVATVGGHIVRAGKLPRVKVRCLLTYTNVKVPFWNGRPPYVTFMAETTDGTLVHFWRGNIKQLSKSYEMKFDADISGPDEDIRCSIACEEIVGSVRVQTIKIVIPATSFPMQSKVPELGRRPTRSLLQGDDIDDEFGLNDLDDKEFLAAIGHAEKFENEYESDRFVDIESIEHKRTTSMQDQEGKVVESVQMENGKWTCNHQCRGGTLKEGQPCKHRCCHEGLDKPRKLSTKKRKTSYGTDEKREGAIKKLKTVDGMIARREQRFGRDGRTRKASITCSSALDSPNNKDADGTEIIDLSGDSHPDFFANGAPEKHHKVPTLHTSIQKDKSLSRPTTKARFSYISAKDPDLPMFQQSSKCGEREVNRDSDDDFQYLLEVANCAEYSSGLSSRYKMTPSDEPQIDESPITTGTDPTLTTELRLSTTHLEPPSETAKMTAQKVDAQFGEEASDSNSDEFGTFHEQFDSPLMKRTIKTTKATAVSLLPAAAPEPADKDVAINGITGLTSDHEIAKGSAQQSEEPLANVNKTQYPAWLDEFDSDLVDSLKNFVDFVE